MIIELLNIIELLVINYHFANLQNILIIPLTINDHSSIKYIKKIIKIFNYWKNKSGLKCILNDFQSFEYILYKKYNGNDDIIF